MKRLFVLLVLLFPSIAIAQPEWSTYCDNGVEKVRLRLTVQIGGVDVQPGVAGGYNNELCGDFNFCGGYSSNPESLGDDYYRFTFSGWLRSCITVAYPAFHVQVFYYTVEPGHEPVLRLFEAWCASYEPVAIVDEVECNTLPVAHSTWGAVKALYR